MKNWFQSKPTGDDTSSFTKKEARLHLAAFGKHPGWEDHIPGIGLRTEGLVHVKQALYVTGIGGQINSGAWRNLEQEKRIPGFDHWFLWRRAGAIFCGRFWSSQDRGGRKEYPMVLCIETAGTPAASLLSKAWTELERLREFCQSTDSAVAVTAECGAAQERLGQAVAGASGAGAMEQQIKKGFLDHPDLGPDRVGWLRALHEVEHVAGSGPSGTDSTSAAFDPSQSHHWRVPRACPTDGGGLLLWYDFLTRALPGNAPLLLITRVNSGWVEVVVGEPQTGDLFCLQASRTALPLATEIPYEQHWEPETRSRLQNQFAALETRFLGDSQTQIITRTGPRPTPTRPSPTSDSPVADSPRPRGNLLRWILPVLLVVVGVGGIGLWLATQRKADSPSISVAPQPEIEPGRFDALLAEARQLAARSEYTNALVRLDEALKLQPGDETATKLKDEVQSSLDVESQYAVAIRAGMAAFEKQQWQLALEKAREALALKPNDHRAGRLQADAQAKIEAAATSEERKRNYAAAMTSAKAAMDRQDYDGVLQHTRVALGALPDDAAAAQLKADAEQRIRDISQADQDYRSATNASAIALQAGDFGVAIREADQALALMPDDPEATRLKAEAQRIQAQASAQARYDQAMTSARAALDAENFTQAVQEADVALGVKPGDSAAQELKARAGKLQQAIAARQQYDRAMSEGNEALDRREFPVALQRALEALRIKSGDEAATALKAKAAAGTDLQKANALLESGDYDQALGLCAAHPGELAFTDLAARIHKAREEATQDQLAEMDIQLQTLLVRFNVIKADDPYVTSAEAKQTQRLSGRLSLQGVDAYLAQVDRLEAGFGQGGWLDENERGRHIDKLRKAIIRAQ